MDAERAERAETYLRVMAETELRRALKSPRYHQRPAQGHDPASARQRLGRVRYVAAALTAVGAIADELAEVIISDLEAALAVRSRVDRGGLRPQPSHSARMRLRYRHGRRHRGRSRAASP